MIGLPLAKLFGGLSIGLALALGVQTLRANHFEKSRDVWKTAHGAQQAAMIAGAAAAEAKAIAAKLAIEAESRNNAERSQDAYNLLLAQMDARSADYARRMRAAQTSGDPRSGTTPPDTDGAGFPPQPPADAVLVSLADFNICTIDAAYALAAHQWAVTVK